MLFLSFIVVPLMIFLGTIALIVMYTVIDLDAFTNGDRVLRSRLVILRMIATGFIIILFAGIMVSMWYGDTVNTKSHMITKPPIERKISPTESPVEEATPKVNIEYIHTNRDYNESVERSHRMTDWRNRDSDDQ